MYDGPCQFLIFISLSIAKGMAKARSESPASAKSSRKHKLDDRYAEVEAEMIIQVRCL